MDYNYGMLDIQKPTDKDHTILRASVRDINGAEVLSKTYNAE